MSEKKVFIFGSRWGSDSETYWKKNIEKKIVFNNEYRYIPQGSYIILKDKSDFIKVGISKNEMKKALISELKIFDSAEDANKYNIDYYNEVVMYLEIDKWLEPVNLELIKKLISDSYYRIKNISQIQDYKNKKIFNEFLKINKLGELGLSSLDNDSKYSILENLLINNYNLILTGAPGTGKTYLAKQIAAKMIFGEDISLDEIENDESKREKFKTQYKFVQFHPSYDYTDFVEGIRPVKEGSSYGFERIDGTFKKFCKGAVYINVEYYKLLISKLKEFCEFLFKETQNKNIEIENVKGIKGKAASIKTVIYNKENETVKIIVDTESGSNGISTKSLHKIAEWYQLYITKFLELDTEKQNMKNFDNILGITYGGSHTYIYGFIKLFHDKYGNELQVPISYQVERDNSSPFVFVIDEINRGDINKILGELFYAVDPGYRGEKGKVETQYQNLVESDDVFSNGFYIPENVYIIGTMNDIDRSVESMDFAIRRRFAWQEIKPEDTADDILKNVKINSAAAVLNDFNKIIASEESLGEMYQLGASYFLKLNKYIDDEKVNDQTSIKEAYQKLWDNHLNSLIYEYVRGKKSGNEIFEIIKNKYFKLTDKNNEENNEDTEK